MSFITCGRNVSIPKPVRSVVLCFTKYMKSMYIERNCPSSPLQLSVPIPYTHCNIRYSYDEHDEALLCLIDVDTNKICVDGQIITFTEHSQKLDTSDISVFM